MMHVSAGTGVEAIAEARRKGLPVYGETLHQYLLYSAEDYKRPNGQIYHTYPSLKSQDDQKALWHGTANDVIHCVATDELCCSLKDKTAGHRIDDTTGGNSGVGPRLGVMYTEMVARRGYSLSRYVELVSTNAAKIMGLYPRKGAIAVGSDADIVVLDPARRGKVRAADLPETDYTPWEGHDVSRHLVTVLRGKVIVEDGKYFASPNDGRYLKRKISSGILNGAAAVSTPHDHEKREPDFGRDHAAKESPERSCVRAAGAKPRRVACRRQCRARRAMARW